MTIKWATFLLQYAIAPTVAVHRRYWFWKVQADKFLELRSWYTVVGIGGALGFGLYCVTFPYLPLTQTELSMGELQEDVRHILDNMDYEPLGELPSSSVFRFRSDTLNKVLVAKDKMAVAQQRKEVEALQQRLEIEKAAILAKQVL